MNLDIITCIDWDYRQWAITLFRSLGKEWRNRYIIAVGKGDWYQLSIQLNATIIEQELNPNFDKVIWCQNVRMKHLHDLLSSMDHGDYLLSIDADFKQNRPFNLDALQKDKPSVSFWCQRKKGKIRGRYRPMPKYVYWQPEDPRFHINAGWCLYKNDVHNRKRLSDIAREWTNYTHDVKNWDQLMLFKYFKDFGGTVPFKYIDEGTKAKWNDNSGGYSDYATWWHCKAGKKQKEKFWHSGKR